MADPRKRSRFDVADADKTSAPTSRSDRRSRSPEARERRTRSRSPVASDAAAAAKEKALAAAARIQASLAEKKLQHVQVPSVPTLGSPSAASGDVKSPEPGAAALSGEMFQQDGDYIKDIEINNLHNRYTLTKSSTQKMIQEKTGADVTTRGEYYPAGVPHVPGKPPLFLHITSTSKEKAEAAIAMIEELMKQDLPNLIDERRFRGNRRDQQEQEPPPPRERRKWPEEHITIDLEPIRGFNIRAKIVGSGGANVKHIQNETRCRVQIKGRDSGFIESDIGREADEPMFLHIAGPEEDMVAHAKSLCDSLLDHIREEYETFRTQGPPPRGNRDGGFNRGGDRHNNGSYGGGGGGGRSGYGGDNGYGGGNNGYGGGYGSSGAYSNADPYAANAGAYGAADPYANAGYDAAAAQAAPAPADPVEAQKQMEAWIAYYAANPEQDPYREYGGYAAMMAQYAQAAAYQQPPQQGYGNTTPGGQAAAAAAPPPPPPDSGPSSGYHAVPPPPPPGAQ